MKTTVLRLGHRPLRDKRLSTHLLLAARAFGASGAFYAGIRDSGLEESVRKIVRDWGGDFSVEYAANWRRVVRDWEGGVVHLTMYGLPAQDVVHEVAAGEGPLLVVVGGPKVPGDVFGLADWNVSVTLQPHSEVSALALFLHMFYGGSELSREHPGARLRIVPSARGKELAVSKD
ncbi:MAG: tRNA (cytidine(56)-2'-O)-methyltransferase [Candidatus Bathyarchaeota archaeon]